MPLTRECPSCHNIISMSAEDFEAHVQLCRAANPAATAAAPRLAAGAAPAAAPPVGETRHSCPICNNHFPRSLIEAHVNTHYDDQTRRPPHPLPHPTTSTITNNNNNNNRVDAAAGIPTKRCPMCGMHVAETLLDVHVGEHLDSGEDMMWQDSGDSNPAVGSGGNPFLPAGGAAAAASAASTAASQTRSQQQQVSVPSGFWRCNLCSVVLPVELREGHERAHARRSEIGGAAMAAAVNSNSAVPTTAALGAAAAGAAAGGGGGIRVQCPICKSIVSEIHLEEHMQRHERGTMAGGSRQNSDSNPTSPLYGAGNNNTSRATAEPTKRCIICSKQVRLSIYEWHVRSCGLDSPTIECGVCMDDVPIEESFCIGCPSAHKTCIDCCHRMIEIAAREGVKARCPGGGCTYRLPSTEVLAAYRGDKNNEVYRRYADFELRTATEGANFFSCKTKDCPNKVLLDDVAKMLPTCMRCQLCMNSTCTLCSSQPFHYRMGCAEARARHAMWIGILRELSGGKDGNQNLVQQTIDAQERYRELQEDENWKALHCRLCSKCSRAIEKLDGCDHVVCGRDADSGANQQDGCGASLNWAQLKPYVPRLPPPPNADKVRGELLSRTVHSEFDRCVMCKDVVRGPRFLCANCPSEESFCFGCVPKFMQTRHKNHFFVVIP